MTRPTKRKKCKFVLKQPCRLVSMCMPSCDAGLGAMVANI